jgi:hypothetical protein
MDWQMSKGELVARGGVQRKPKWNISLPNFETSWRFGMLHADELEESLFHAQGSVIPISQPPPAYRLGIRATHRSSIVLRMMCASNSNWDNSQLPLCIFHQLQIPRYEKCIYQGCIEVYDMALLQN